MIEYNITHIYYYEPEEIKMWKRSLRKYNRITYRKRFLCPICDQYTLHIEHDAYAECEECGNLHQCDIDLLVKENNFQGYYTLDDLNELFINIDSEANKQLKSTLLRNVNLMPAQVFNVKERNEIIDLFLISTKFDELLDDASIQYFRIHPDRESGINTSINDNEYWFNLIEDAHFFANNVLLGIIFYEYGTVKGTEYLKLRKLSPVFSGNFFITNCVFSCTSAWERVINILCLLFNVAYDTIPKNNTFDKLYNKLKKVPEFKNSNMYLWS